VANRRFRDTRLREEGDLNWTARIGVWPPISLLEARQIERNRGLPDGHHRLGVRRRAGLIDRLTRLIRGDLVEKLPSLLKANDGYRSHSCIE